MSETLLPALGQTLANSLADALETMFFEFAEPSEAGDFAACPVCCSVSFCGGMTGNLEICLGSELARELTANFLGIDADCPSPEEVESVACELANMICGSALSRLEPEGAIQLAQPAAIPVPDAARDWLWFITESGPLAVSLRAELS